jgi:uncharacterized protein (DUF3084 family)
VLNTGDRSTGGLFRITAMAWADPSKPVVKEVEERADALIKQLEDTDRYGVRMFSILFLVSSLFCAFV